MDRRFNRDRFTWLAYLLVAFYGYFLNILGPLTPFLKSDLHLSYTVSSLHFSALAVGVLITGLGGNLIIERLGRWRSLWVGVFGMSLSALILTFGTTPWLTIGACFLMGLIGSMILAIIPGALSEQHGDLRIVAISESNVIGSIVAMTAPLLVGLSMRLTGNWRLSIGVVALTPLLFYPALGKGLTLVDASKHQERHNGKQGLPGLFWLYWVAIVLAVSVEFCMISWSADFLENVFKMQKTDAVQAVSLFFAAMIVGRFVVSRLSQRYATEKLITVSIILASIGFLIFWKTGFVMGGLIGLFLTGLGVAGLYPMLLSLGLGVAGDHINEASARATLATGVAILTLPLVLGRLADSVGIEMAYSVVVVLLLAVFLITFFVRKKSITPEFLA